MIANRIIIGLMTLLVIELVVGAVWVHNDFKGVDSVLNIIDK